MFGFLTLDRKSLVDDWLYFVGVGAHIRLVKEMRFAIVDSIFKNDYGIGQIGLLIDGSPCSWYVSESGTGFDGSQILLPCERFIDRRGKRAEDNTTLASKLHLDMTVLIREQPWEIKQILEATEDKINIIVTDGTWYGQFSSGYNTALKRLQLMTNNSCFGRFSLYWLDDRFSESEQKEMIQKLMMRPDMGEDFFARLRVPGEEPIVYVKHSVYSW